VFSIIWYPLIFVLYVLGFYLVLAHPPVDYFNVFVLTACFAFIIFTQIKAIARQRKTIDNGYN
jgi:hypothetical protein